VEVLVSQRQGSTVVRMHSPRLWESLSESHHLGVSGRPRPQLGKHPLPNPPKGRCARTKPRGAMGTHKRAGDCWRAEAGGGGSCPRARHTLARACRPVRGALDEAWLKRGGWQRGDGCVCV
jgi:hypothetical protein